jgi:Immunoglobulin domain
VADTDNDIIRRGSLQILSVGIGTPPTITAQPKSVTVAGGAAFSFSVTATGSTPLTYQWLLNGTAIPGATGATYAVVNSTSAEAGNYTVVVSNTAGSVTSTAATLAFGTTSTSSSGPDTAGGGAPSGWFDLALALLGGARLLNRRRPSSPA